MISALKKKDYTTLIGTFCGVFAIVLSIGFDAQRGAMQMILWGSLADLLDGWVARKTGEFNEFGIQIDTLSDSLVFGIAPAIVVFMTYSGQELTTEAGITNYSPYILIVPIFIFIAAGIVRLSYFNTIADKDTYEGTPIPVTASILIMVMFTDYVAFLLHGGEEPSIFNSIIHYSIPIFLLFLAWLNVTEKIKYDKTIKKKGGWMKYFIAILAVYMLSIVFMFAFGRNDTGILWAVFIMMLPLNIIWISFTVHGIKTAKKMKE